MGGHKIKKEYITSNCKYCNKDFAQPKNRAKLKEFCDRKCAARGGERWLRMKNNNPMFDESIRSKVSKTSKRQYEMGERISTMLGKQNIGTSIYMKENNPSFNSETIIKRTKTRKEKNNYKCTEENKQKAKVWGKEYAKNNPFHFINMSKKGRENQRWKKTSIEKEIENILQELNISFIYQYQIERKNKRNYFVDFFIPNCNLIIQCDGNYWHKYPNYLESDIKQDYELMSRGFNGLRFWESEIKNKQYCKNMIFKVIQNINKGDCSWHFQQ